MLNKKAAENSSAAFPFESVFLFRFDSLFQGVSQLVRAGGRLGAAADALDNADDFFSGTADAEGCDTLGVAGAAAGEENSLDNAVFDGKVDFSGTYAAGREGIRCHNNFILSFDGRPCRRQGLFFIILHGKSVKVKGRGKSCTFLSQGIPGRRVEK